MSATFYATFGQRYRREVHPSGLPLHPDGVLKVTAPTYSLALQLVIETIGHDWAFLYPERYIDLPYYPRGVLLELS